MYCVRFTERKDWLYDPAVFTRADTATALKLHSEYVRKHSPVPYPKFFEVDVTSTAVDPLWHTATGPKTKFSRTLDMPCIVQPQKADWRLTRIGIVPQQVTTFWLGNLILKDVDYFPSRGDYVYYNGYRQMITKVEIRPEGFWQQTNVWLGMTVDAVIAAEGDSRPVLNPGVAAPAELYYTQAKPEV